MQISSSSAESGKLGRISGSSCAANKRELRKSVLTHSAKSNVVNAVRSRWFIFDEAYDDVHPRAAELALLRRRFPAINTMPIQTNNELRAFDEYKKNEVHYR